MGRLPGDGTMLPLEIVDDHMLVTIDGEVTLIDTGAPVSMPAPAIVTRELGRRVDRIMGVDRLQDGPVLLDWPSRRVGFAPAGGGGVEVPLRASCGLYQVEVVGDGTRGWGFLDTGAKLSYAPAAACERLEAAGSRADFYPGFGAFEVPTYRMEISVGPLEIRGLFGVLPPLLRQALSIVGSDGWIIGSDLFRDRAIVLDFPNLRLMEAGRH